MSKSFWEHPIETIEKALDIRKKIEGLQDDLAEMCGNGTISPVVSNSALVQDRRRGKRSPALRAKMATAQQARWAANRGASSKTAPLETLANLPATKETTGVDARTRKAVVQSAGWAKQKTISRPAVAEYSALRNASALRQFLHNLDVVP